MAKANESQLLILEGLRLQVLEVMEELAVWQDSELKRLEEIPLGVLRKDSTQRHGVTRWKKGVDISVAQISNVDLIDIHPNLLNAEWWSYARFVLYHEYLHALGNIAHDSGFRNLESLWPDSVNGKSFTERMRIEGSSWIWRCSSCGKGYHRRKRSMGRYRCRSCNCVLVDEVNRIATKS